MAKWVGSASVMSAAVMGLDVRPVSVEVSLIHGTPLMQIVGLAQSAVREGRERIRAAAAQLGLHVPGLRITVNLAPADLPKTGAALDLPIMLGILCAKGDLPQDALDGTLAVGELGLDGSLRPIRGALPIALFAAANPQVARLLLPVANLREASAAEGIAVGGSESLTYLLAALNGKARLREPAVLLSPAARTSGDPAPDDPGFDLSAVKGQPVAKRALEIAAAGGHNLLFSGSPGSGKTSLARCLPGLLPTLDVREAVDVTAIHSIAGLLADGSGLKRARPFRAPHHSISEAGLIGGGTRPRPGEASLAHHGVLFLDELPEFGRRTLEALRQPIEEGQVRIVRAAGSASFPAEFTLVAAMNPCPCGFLGVPGRCRCLEETVLRYRRRVSGPLLDRIDMLVDVPAVRWEQLAQAASGDTSAVVRTRVSKARARAARRHGTINARIPPVRLEEACRIDRGGRSLLRKAVTHLGLTARGYHRALRVARTIADLEGRGRVSEDHVAEAIRFRGPC
ncbi:YifB family Mg chelatase-like AAA ATPase [Candidatus Palauibacter polyketidifaciens]|uniref:YifB family Mg chelatase-like AAA ATPase n=1 Tax=Candidatus Palauibacter polyketidifaciens TaxID=3056740 RepID=UPI00239FC938|nr:YifB family Mg chelatase-like AAA ATPase [Candidatus Palauibacter polyketidifaciens]MDE2721420.1 YifB family Mg chelatase-like AAA ATPase [Candidatus Palauibacter polyketidifaciens]